MEKKLRVRLLSVPRPVKARVLRSVKYTSGMLLSEAIDFINDVRAGKPQSLVLPEDAAEKFVSEMRELRVEFEVEAWIG